MRRNNEFPVVFVQWLAVVRSITREVIVPSIISKRGKKEINRYSEKAVTGLLDVKVENCFMLCPQTLSNQHFVVYQLQQVEVDGVSLPLEMVKQSPELLQQVEVDGVSLPTMNEYIEITMLQQVEVGITLFTRITNK